MATSSERDPNSSLPGWTDLYGHNQAGISSVTSMSMPDLTATSGSGSSPGRVGKSPRRRSRASRRAPVTLLNTDTSNFRAMVQQFTGIPSSSSSSGAYTSGISGSGGPTISFSAPNINPMRPNGGGGGGGGGGVMSFGGGGQPQQYQYQYQSRQPPFQEQIYHSRQQQQQQQYDENTNNMFTQGQGENMFIDGTGAGAGGYHDMHVTGGIFGDNNNNNNNTNHAAHSATDIHLLRAHDHRYFG